MPPIHNAAVFNRVGVKEVVGCGLTVVAIIILSCSLIAAAILTLIWAIGCSLIAVAVHFGEINPGNGAFLGGLIIKTFEGLAITAIISVFLAITGIILLKRR